MQELSGSLFLAEVMSLQYFSIKSLNQHNLRDRPSALRIFFAVVLFTCLAALAALFTLSDNKTDQNVTAKNILMFVIQKSMNVFTIFLVASGMVQSYIKTTSVKNIFWNTKEITQMCLDEFKSEIDFKLVKKTSRKRLLQMAVCQIISYGTMTYFSYRTPFDIIVLSLGSFPIFFYFVVLYKFVFFVQLINFELKFLKKILNEVFANELAPVADSSSIHFVTPTTNKIPTNPLRKLVIARKVYDKIYENGEYVNDSMGFTIFVMLMNLVICMTCTGYEVFIVLAGDLPKDKLPGTAYMVVISLNALFHIVYFCQLTDGIVSVERTYKMR